MNSDFAQVFLVDNFFLLTKKIFLTLLTKRERLFHQNYLEKNMSHHDRLGRNYLYLYTSLAS